MKFFNPSKPGRRNSFKARKQGKLKVKRRKKSELRIKKKVKVQKSKGGNMKNLKMAIIFLLIGVAVVYVVYQQQQKPVVIKTKTELVKGREEVSYFKGKEIESKKLKVESGKKKAKIDSAGIAKVALKFDDSIKVKVEVKVERDSAEIFFNLSYFEKSFLRVDTMKIYRLDTLKIETKKIIVEEIPFYEKFWFGGILGGVLVLLIVIASGK